jgi:hypothetical protein
MAYCPIEKNIRGTIKRMQRRGTSGASIDCLFQNTPTKGVDVPQDLYRQLFSAVAERVAKDLGFELLSHFFAFATDSESGHLSAKDFPDACEQLSKLVPAIAVQNGGWGWVADQDGSRFEVKLWEYQPKTGRPCGCRPGNSRDNCPRCEGTGMEIDFAAIRSR